MQYRPRGVLPMQYGLPQLPPARQGAPMAPGSVTTGPAQEQRQGGGLGGLGDAASLYRMVKAQAKAPMNPMTSTYQGDMALQAVPFTGQYTPYNMAWGGDMAVAGVSPSGMGMTPDPLLYGGEAGFDALVGGSAGADALAGGAMADTLGGGLLGAAGAGVAPAMGAAVPLMEAALPAAAIEAVGAPAAAGAAGLGALGPIGLGLGGIFGLGKLMDWW